MTPDQIAVWWCCQADATRVSLLAVLALYTANPTGTVKALLDAALSAAGYTTDSPQYDLWVSTFQVQFVEVTIDGVDVTVVLFDPIFWPALVLFVTDPGPLCPEPCPMLKFSLDHL